METMPVEVNREATAASIMYRYSFVQFTSYIKACMDRPEWLAGCLRPWTIGPPDRISTHYSPSPERQRGALAQSMDGVRLRLESKPSFEPECSQDNLIQHTWVSCMAARRLDGRASTGTELCVYRHAPMPVIDVCYRCCWFRKSPIGSHT
jgi:hypothetical protein